MRCPKRPRRGDAAKVKELLDAGVDVNTKFRCNRTALSFAADRAISKSSSCSSNALADA